VKLDDKFPEHPKVASITEAKRPHAVYLHISALCWCNRNLTDGRIPRGTLSRLTPEIDTVDSAAALVSVGIWEETPEGYNIHDYSDFQPSRRQVVSRQTHIHTVRAAAGALGGAKRKQSGSKAQAKRTQTVSPVARVRTTPLSPSQEAAPDDLGAVWDTWVETANTHGTPIRLTASQNELAILDDLCAAYSVKELTQAITAFWDKPSKARNLAYFKPQVAELLTPEPPAYDLNAWEPGYHHFWTCKECGEVHGTNIQAEYGKKCLKKRNVATRAEYEAWLAAQKAIA
jgi:hypothetical protein